MSNVFFKILDAIIITIARAFVPIRPIEQQIATISKFSDDEFDYFRELIDTVQSRASILLGHLAIVLAVLALSVGNYGAVPNMLKLFSGLIIAFLFLTIVLLRVVGSVASQAEEIASRDAYLDLIKKECSIRYCLFRFSIFATVVLTISLMIGFVLYPPISIPIPTP